MAHNADVRPSGWKTETGRAEYLDAYEAAMELWPVPYASLQVETRFGSTHVIESGSAEGKPLVLLHAATGFGSTQWYPNVAALSASHKMYAIDYIGSAGKGAQTRPMFGREDCRDWLGDVFDGLELTQPMVAGSSQGGWLGLNLALLAPERVAQIALLAPAASILPFRKRVQLGIALGPFMPAWTGPASIKAMVGGRVTIDERIVRLLTLHLAHFRYQRRAPFPSAFPDDELRRLPARTLLLIGEHEMIYDAERALGRACRLIPDAETDLVADVGHLINMERPEFTTSRLLRFFSRSDSEVADLHG